MVSLGNPIVQVYNQFTGANLADLPYHNIQADISTPCQQIADFFKQYPNLPAIIITKNGQFHSLISRKRFFELLSRPFGVEVFLKRSVSEMISHMASQVLRLPHDEEISKAVQKALSREPDFTYDPVIIERDGQYGVVDMYTLLLHMARSLDNANQIIFKQFQIAHQLSDGIEFENIFYSILEKTKSVISFDEGLILNHEESGWKVVTHSGSLPINIIDEIIQTNFLEILTESEVKNQQISVREEGELRISSNESDFKLNASFLLIPLQYSEFSLGAMLLMRIEHHKNYMQFIALNSLNHKKNVFIPFQKVDEILLLNLESTFSSAVRNTQLISQIQDLAVTDSLINIKNRRGFYSEASRSLLISKNNCVSFCILIIDIDHFKAVNDNFGHAMGDQVLCAVVEKIKTCLRETDLLGRYGGDEFIVLLPDVSINVAENIAARIRREILAMMVNSPNGNILITASVGISPLRIDRDDLDYSIRNADEALLLAKKVGRNQTVIWDNGRFVNNGFAIQVELPDFKESTTLADQVGFNGMEEVALSQTIDDLIEGYVHALELRDKETEGHTQRVAQMTVELAIRLGINQADLLGIKRGALLHDIGKIAVPDKILLKPGPLNEKEWEIMRKHPTYAYDLLSNNIFLRSCMDIPYNHHERWDGTGYPRKLEKTQIPLSARVFSIIDVWDALNSQRIYRAAWTRNDAINYIAAQTGKHFDPEIAHIFMEMVQNQRL